MTPEKHLLVDASNIMHAWPDLRRLLKGDRDAARSRLSQILVVLHDAEALRLTIVYDGRGGELVVECPTKVPTFAHVYTPEGMTADDFIEQTVGRAAVPAACVVATDDRAERQTVEATGAACLSSVDLLAWVERVEQRQGVRLESRRRENEKHWRRGKG